MLLQPSKGNTKKVSHWTPDMRVPKVLLPPPKKLDFWPKNGQLWPQIVQTITFFTQSYARPKNNANKRGDYCLWKKQSGLLR